MELHILDLLVYIAISWIILRFERNSVEFEGCLPVLIWIIFTIWYCNHFWSPEVNIIDYTKQLNFKL